MNTTAAATEARVTVATIRTWCRIGAVAAAKAAGRWVIDTASLAARIAIGKMKRPATKRAPWTAEMIVAIGGRRWQKNGMDRVYLNDWPAFAGLEISHYGTGNIASASYQGNGISNRQAYKLLWSINKVWFDTADGKLHCRYGIDESRVADRDELWDAVVAGVRAATDAL
ncbi:hypothetical protein [Streptomyces antibioticus]|uniref:hypothetical protein n=1 Tax=Streptomyces antibioticus TaxID=1890 RepID=UPI003698A221